MNVFVSLLLSILFSGHLFEAVRSDGLIAINDAWSVRTLYIRIGNGDAPSAESDRAFTDANIRKRICEEITSSRYFPKEHWRPVNMEPDILSTTLRDDDMFSRIYVTRVEPNRTSNSVSSYRSSGTLKLTFEYQNFFAPREFGFFDFQGRKTRRLEHVFMCLIEDKYNSEIYPFYVSKEYNVVGDPFRAGRFIFWERGAKFSTQSYTLVLLAEEPAKVFEDKDNPKYDVELKYLERRQDLPLAPDDTSDPVCSLISEFGPDNEEDRLCAMVLTSSDFQRTTEVMPYPESWCMGKCGLITVSFQSAEAKKIVGEKVYRERALSCECKNSAHNNRHEYFYITRAYIPNEVFVLKYDYRRAEIFLKNLSIDVGIVRGGVTV